MFDLSLRKSSGGAKSSAASNRWKKIALESFANVSNWSFIQRSNGAAATAWTVANGVLSSPASGTVDTYALMNGVELNDGRIQMIYENPDSTVNSGYVGIILRGKSTNDLLAVIINHGGSKTLDFYKFPAAGGALVYLTGTNLSNYPETTMTTDPMQLEVEIVGLTMKAYLNGKLMLNSTHAEILNFTTGTTCGIVANYPRSYQVSNFSVKSKLYNMVNPSNVGTVVCIGSSISNGAGATNPQGAGDYSYGWVGRFAANLNANFVTKPVNMIKAGIDGNTTTQMLARFDTDVIANNPDLVVIEASPNDLRIDQQPVIWTTTIENLRQMIKKVKQTGAIPLLTSPTPMNPAINTGSFNSVGAKQIPLYLARVRQLALQEDVILIDNNTAFNGYSASMFFDGVHPNNAGHQLMADTALNTLLGKM